MLISDSAWLGVGESGLELESEGLEVWMLELAGVPGV